LPNSPSLADHPAPQGWNVIPDGYGGVTSWRGQGGTDAYTAGIIGQGLSRMSRPAPAPLYTPPPLTVPEMSRDYRQYDQAVQDRMLDYIQSRGR
jgi:hypothetical protein